MIRKVLAGAIALHLLTAGSLLGYGWWTRRGAPEFSQGGAFGVTQSIQPAERARVKGAREAGGPSGARAERRRDGSVAAPGEPGSKNTGGGVRVLIPYPALGSYGYAGSGSESVTFGSASPCSWQVDDVTLSVNKDGGERVFDWAFSDQRIERHVIAYDTRALYTTFVGSAVTCLGVRKTSENDYPDHSIYLPLPLEAGESWHETIQLSDRTEEVRARVVDAGRITVPAGTFTVSKLTIHGELRGEQEGTFDITRWFSPDLGVVVKDIVKTNVVSGSIHFTSDYTIELSSLPA